ncbi:MULTISPECIES: sel1 repeat family protein [unclassified Pseudomonas]|uniref:tetratricopeptide repeat protein n=1 Tax=unclassified Pseudomonas TaxID=196821 RepID=UPI002AC9E018|nr:MULTISPECIES: sel1 repeat family protein [unclassified Pseudomonas]MEB0045175.1 sel1 repeat family protein [Pseudomonas sp. Dout3]MEB0096469.1 sel1 repeat family protein [Pseudomonas sp. DC1.2]WPX61421.1 sel1 repeat family protein [Pseudomonas sp. DC1.2]
MKSSKLKSALSFLLCILFFSTNVQAELSQDQLAAKNKGIELYNQFKAISATPQLKIAADAGDHEAQYYLGEAIRKNKKYMTPEALSAYEASALQGDIYSMIRLAGEKNDLCVAMGNCPKGRKEPGEWGKMAIDTAGVEAAKGNAEAMYLMFIVTGDDKWLEKSAEKGYAFAQYFLGVSYREGRGFFILPSSRAEVVERLMKASAEGGYPQGMLEYGAILAEKKDLQGFRFWNEKAAETGYATAIFGYGSDIGKESSEFGYTYDPVKSYALLHLLLELDGGGGMPDYVNYVLPNISDKMSPKQIEKAKMVSKEWKDSHPPLSFFPDKL